MELSASLAFDWLSQSARAVTANVIELPGYDERRPFISGALGEGVGEGGVQGPGGDHAWPPSRVRASGV